MIHKTQVVRADPRTGKLVRSIVVSSRPVITKIAPPLSASSSDLNAIVEKAARAHEVDPLLVHSIIKVESNYNIHAVSNKGAEGLMQLTPSTARMLGVSNSFDPQQNIEAGVKYLKYLKDLYKDDRLALAAYNAGPGAVDKYKCDPARMRKRKITFTRWASVTAKRGARPMRRNRRGRSESARSESGGSDARGSEAGTGGAFRRREWQATSQDLAVGRDSSRVSCSWPWCVLPRPPKTTSKVSAYTSGRWAI